MPIVQNHEDYYVVHHTGYSPLCQFHCCLLPVQKFWLTQIPHRHTEPHWAQWPVPTTLHYTYEKSNSKILTVSTYISFVHLVFAHGIANFCFSMMNAEIHTLYSFFFRLHNNATCCISQYKLSWSSIVQM